MNPEAQELNTIIQANNKSVFKILSRRGRAIYFPAKGLMSQAAEAKLSKYNATAGVGIEENGTPMALESLMSHVYFPPEKVVSYSPSHGNQNLREAWLAHIKQKNPSLQTLTSLPVVTAGITHGLYVAGYLLVDQGDEIILPGKFWENYSLVFEHGFGGKLKPFNTFSGEGFNTLEFKKALSKGSRKKIVLFNFPNNPTGYSPTIKEAKIIFNTLKQEAKNGKIIAIICDDAYFGLNYETNVYTQSLFAELSNIHENIIAVKVDGATKEEYAWGLRVGFVTIAYKGIETQAAKAFGQKIAGIVRGSVSNSSTLSQELILETLRSKNFTKEKRQKFAILKSRYERVKQILLDPKFQTAFTPLPFNSGYFMCLELKRGLNAEKIRKLLLEKYGTGVIANENIIRVAYSAIPEKKLSQIFNNIYSACKEQI